ncbi:hypothetical protein AJ79_00627 [Helicocarpus griseus UAMH5409]|uniref:AB hydrolase-1 domain-containing protein n=1 Tax=Helicocarpus griseus UAMH5409 TaxID=1447875 RepID=A0A2B7YBJ5_9EURO|nr:hypothetical protein AJ79_00627 [Helicocarpus griseus UAMH5409]
MAVLAGPHITANSFLTTTTNTSSIADETEPTLLFFIPGNPGLISYYHTYLSLLALELSTNASNPECIIHGKSLGGFEIAEDRNQEPTRTDTKLNSLSDQIDHAERNLSNFVADWHVSKQQGQGLEAGANGDQKEPRPKKSAKVILIGHSVGAYIAMEILRRHREGKAATGKSSEDRDMMEIIGGILLFPTVVDIAKSSSGRKLTQLLYIPYLAVIASLLAKFLAFILPENVLRSMVGTVMGSPPESAVDTTVGFLKSRRGVEQAIHMAADEMREITSDKWSDEIWGIASSSSTASKSTSNPVKLPPNLVLYFAQSDHWVADQTRDEIIQARGSLRRSTGNNGPVMQVCEDGVVHGFCIRHSDIMAKKTARFVRDILQSRQDRFSR